MIYLNSHQDRIIRIELLGKMIQLIVLRLFLMFFWRLEGAIKSLTCVSVVFFCTPIMVDTLFKVYLVYFSYSVCICEGQNQSGVFGAYFDKFDVIFLMVNKMLEGTVWFHTVSVLVQRVPNSAVFTSPVLNEINPLASLQL